ncbi:phage tail protein [Streptomyces sp. JJ66]|uniref:phage tail protein n=1 Tax=Streptomyces sp. JJ66 TaxID=2803843 RepID=UPI0027D8B1CE|nr:phage tail protein [Streptomyces sp. JJ66]
MKTAADKAAVSVSKFGKRAVKTGPQMTKMNRGVKKATGGFKSLNKEMKGNFFGLLLSLIAPIIEKIVAMATQSKTMQKVMKKVFAVVGEVMKKAMKIIGPLLKSLGKIFKSVFNAIKAVVMVVVKLVVKYVKTYFAIFKAVITTAMKVVRNVINAVMSGIKKVIGPVVGWIKRTVPAAFRAVRDKMSEIWGKLSGIARDAFNKVKDGVRGPINGVIDLINSMVGKINGIKVSIPGWVPKVGGKTFGVSLPTIPKLAEGGVVTPRSGGVPAILAEAGEAEAVLPLSKLDALLGRTAARARSGMPGPYGGSAGAGGGGLHIEHYYATEVSDPQETADALMFLAKARG